MSLLKPPISVSNEPFWSQFFQHTFDSYVIVNVLLELFAACMEVRTKLCWVQLFGVATDSISTLPSVMFEEDIIDAVKFPEYDPLT